MDDILNILNNIHFDNMVRKIYPPEIQLKEPIPLILKPHFWICICQTSNDIVSTKNYDKRDDFDFEIFNF